MPVLTQLFDSEIPQNIAFMGGKGRNFLINKLALELTRQGKTVVICHPENKVLPVLGKIVVAKTEKSLFNKISQSLESEKIVFAGSGSSDEFISGLSAKMAEKLSASGLADFYFYILGPADEKSFLKENAISDAIALKFINFFLFCFQADHIDLEIPEDELENVAEFYSFYPELKENNLLRQEIVADYLAAPKHGILNAIHGRTNFKLIFSNINNILAENKVINIARELKRKKVNEVYMANLNDEILKKVIT